MTSNDAKKIFLSHKGSDKEKVVDIKDTLELLGYNPWLDDDAMPAGTSVDRGILEGMKTSCAVVFFVTSSFEDEGYLRTEVDHAVREKREKGDRFAIITLVLPDSGGDRAHVPDLLKPYVWKTPRTDLEALREIIRALPVEPGVVAWRSGVTDGTVALTKGPSEQPDISKEAKAILCAAAADNGVIMHIRTMGGESIQTGRDSLVPDQKPRTVARWKAGIGELQERRYIEDRGKGEVFDVTKSGYDAADTLCGK